MKKNVSIILLLFILFSITDISAQFGKKKKKNKFECGYVHKKTLKERLNVGALAGRVVGGLFMKGSDKFDYSTTAVTIARANHIYPLGYCFDPYKTRVFF